MAPQRGGAGPEIGRGVDQVRDLRETVRYAPQRDRFRIAITVGWGSSHLHSTGQMHKGGPISGLFIQVIGDDREDLAIPGAGYGFSTLKAVQALGSFGPEAKAAIPALTALLEPGTPGRLKSAAEDALKCIRGK